MSWVQVNLLARGLSRGWGSICRTVLSGTPFAQPSLQARGLHCSAVTHKDDVWLVPRPSEPQKKPIKVPAMHEDLFRPSGNGEQDKASFLNAVRSFGEHNVRKRGHVDFIYLALRKMPEFGVERDLSVYNLLLDVFPKEVFRPRNAIQRIFVHYPRQQECGVAVLGEAHGPWVDLRRRSGWSDAKLAAYLISLERGQRSGRHGKPWEQVPKKPKRKKRRRRNVNCLKNVVIWYEDHKHRCPYEPHLAELDPTFGLYTTAVWQCEAGHRYFQDLHSPLKPLSDSEPDSDKVGNGLAAGSSDSSSSSSSSDSEEPPETQPAKAPAAAAAVTPSSPTGSSGLITQEGVHIPFDVHHVESLAEQGTPLCQNPAGSGPEALETVVCVPVPMQVGTGPGTLFENMPQEALGEVVASCPVSGMVPGSQVIIIAGPGYDALTAEGIHLNVAAGSGTPSSSLGEEVSCAMMEGVAAYTQTEPEGTQHSTMDTTSIASIETKKDTAPCHPVEKEDLYMLKEEKEDSVAPELAELAATVPENTEAEAEVDGEELDSSEMSAIIYEIPKEPEKRRRSKRSRVMDADGLLEMFHCPYEGCSQVYVALSSFQNHVNLVHRKGKTKVCPHPGCGKKFYLSNHLRRHMIIHSGVREFTCETCGKSFKRKNHLEVHRRTHTGETPLQCEICGYQCRQRASLNWHMKKHTAEVQYNFTCDRCGKRFEKLDSVKFHTLKSHPDHKPA